MSERISSWTPTYSLRFKMDATRCSMERLVRLFRRGGFDAECAAKNAEVATKTGASVICADPANNDTNMKTEMIKPSCRRMKDGWAPALEYDNGGVVIAAIRCGTINEALRDASEMLGCMSDYPDAFTHNHPAPNQLIDLANTSAQPPKVG